MMHPLLWPALPLLLPVQWLYRALVALRLWLYRRGVLTTHRAAAPVVAVGNLSVGGSGKTPVVDWLARLAMECGLSPATISRGYKSRSRGRINRALGQAGTPVDPDWIGDEPALLAARNPSLPVYAGRDRVAAAALASVVDRPDVMLLDDGYQHLRLARQLNVLLVDGERGLEGGRVLPLGRLREPLSALGRADVILITKSSAEAARRLMDDLRQRHGVTVPVFACGYRPRALRRLDGEAEHPPEWLEGREVNLLCAIANPASFSGAVSRAGAQVSHVEALPDHFAYPPRSMARLEGMMAGAENSAGNRPGRPDDMMDRPASGPPWITTEKDAVKLRGRLDPAHRLWVLEMEIAPPPEAVDFFRVFFVGLREKAPHGGARDAESRGS